VPADAGAHLGLDPPARFRVPLRPGRGAARHGQRLTREERLVDLGIAETSEPSVGNAWPAAPPRGRRPRAARPRPPESRRQSGAARGAAHVW
jgi:hypothetical protein